MKFKGFLFFLFVLLSGAIRADASPEDTAKKEVKIPTLIKYIDEHAFSTQRFMYYSLDTALDGIEIENVAVRYHYNYLSNIGSAVSSQVFFSPNNIFTDLGFHSYDLYLFNADRIRYFKTNKAYSEINYHLGSGKDAQITVALSENISKNWNIGLDFNRSGSEGFLKNGITFHSNFELYSWLHSQNSRYNLLAHAFWNTTQNKVNGGVSSDSVYDNTPVSNLSLQGILINLADAENHFYDREFAARQFYDLGIKVEEKVNDTVTVKRFIPTGRIEHSIRFESKSFTYLDINSGDFYKNSYFSASTLDSLHFYDLRNRIAWSSVLNSRHYTDSLHAIYYSVAAEHQWISYEQTITPDLDFKYATMQNVSVNGELTSFIAASRFFWKIKGNSIFAGENKGDYRNEATLHAPFGKFGYIDLSGQLLMRSPELIYERYFSNHFIWANNFEKSTVKNVSAEYSYPKFKVSIGAEESIISNFIHLDSTATPIQETSGLRVTKFFLTKNFRFRKIHFNNSFIIQKVNNENELHLPSFITTQSLFFESFLYQGTLEMQIGVDFHFHTAYYSDAFMPATGLFYWQNIKKTGGYSLGDLFFNFRIKTARFFAKLENLTDDIVSKGYYLTPHYPMQGMTITFGINWRFFDQ